MATFKKLLLSASTNGAGIIVSSGTDGTAGTAGTIHTVGTKADVKEEVWLYAYNSAAAAVVLSVELGSVSLPRKMSIPSQSGNFLVVPGFVFQSGAKIQAYASSAGVVVVDGYVNEITDT